MIIGVDLDGVIANIHDIALREFNAMYATVATIADITAYSGDVHGRPFTEFIFKVIEDEKLNAEAPVVEGAVTGMQKLGVGNELVIVTSRPKTPTPWIRSWLDNNNIHYKWLLNTGHAHKKLVRTDVLIDDYPGNFEGYVGQPILFDRPWNRDNQRLVRARGWDGVLSIVEAMQ